MSPTHRILKTKVKWKYFVDTCNMLLKSDTMIKMCMYSIVYLYCSIYLYVKYSYFLILLIHAQWQHTVKWSRETTVLWLPYSDQEIKMLLWGSAAHDAICLTCLFTKMLKVAYLRTMIPFIKKELWTILWHVWPVCNYYWTAVSLNPKQEWIQCLRFGKSLKDKKILCYQQKQKPFK